MILSYYDDSSEAWENDDQQKTYSSCCPECGSKEVFIVKCEEEFIDGHTVAWLDMECDKCHTAFVESGMELACVSYECDD